MIRSILRWWRQIHPKAQPCAADELARYIPAYREAMTREAIAKRRERTQALNRARKAKRDALHDNMLGKA